MSTATPTKTKTRGAPAAPATPATPASRTAPAKCCARCGIIILGYVQILELCRLTHRGADMERYILCCGCCDAIRSYLGARPIPAQPG